MSTLPIGFAHLILAFAPLVFQTGFPVRASIAHWRNTWHRQTHRDCHLARMGLDRQTHFQTCHRVLNRAVWSSLAASRILLSLPVRARGTVDP